MRIAIHGWLALLLVLLSFSWSLAQEEQVRLKVRSVPSDLTVWRSDKALPRNPEDGTFLIERPEEILEVELRSPGYHPQKMEIKVSPQQSLVHIPAEPNEIIYLRPKSKKVHFQSEPKSQVFLQTGRSAHLLGQTGRPLEVPPSAGSGRYFISFQAPGYHTRNVEISEEQMAAKRYPAEGPIYLEPLLPLLSPAVLWLSSRRFVAVTLLIILGLAAVILARKIIKSRASSL